MAIIAAFFLPLFNETVMGTAISAWQMLTTGVKNIDGASNLPISQLVLSICLVVVIVCIVVILAFSVMRKATSVLLNLVPLLCIIGLIIFSMLQATDNVGQTLQSFGTGFYIMFLSSFLLPFTSIAVPTTAQSR
jgi:hypothetical protein